MDKQSVEDKFREGLKDFALFLQKLGPLFDSVDDLTQTVLLATENDAQLRLLIKLAAQKR